MRILLIIILTIFSITAFGQTDQAIWSDLRTVKTDYYELKVPSDWRQMPTIGQGPELLLEASGRAFPAAYNGWPVIVTVFFVKQDGANLEDCKQKCLDGYRGNPDRVFPEKFRDGQERVKLTDGQEAFFLNTRFYRKSKELNQSRFDLIVYSDKAKSGYIYTVSVQYADGDYQFETDNNLSDFAKKLYSYLTLAS